TLRQKCDFNLCFKGEASDDAVAACESPSPSRIAPDGVALNTQWTGMLEGLYRSVQRIRHVSMNSIFAVEVGACPAATAYRFIIGEGLSVPWVGTADRNV